MLKLDMVTAGYNKTPIIKEINAEFNQGEITAIIGPNGSGKSTLLKTIVDLCEVYEGEVLLDGTPRVDIGGKEFAKRVSYLPQSHTSGAITVFRMVLHGRFPYLTYPRRYKKEDYECCIRAMEQVGILPLKDKKVEQLSGGQRQKVYLAMALSGGMDIFLFDEPTTFLDIKYQLELLDIMKKLRNEKKTVITVLHDLNLALQAADKVIIMENGNIVFLGDANNILDNGMLDDVFKVKTKVLSDEEGKRYLYFSGKA